VVGIGIRFSLDEIKTPLTITFGEITTTTTSSLTVAVRFSIKRQPVDQAPASTSEDEAFRAGSDYSIRRLLVFG